MTHELLVSAACLILPSDALATGVTALQLAGVRVGPEQPLNFVTDHAHQVRRPGIRVSRVRLLPPKRGTCVRADYAFVAAAAQLDLVELVIAGDWLVRLGLAQPPALVDAATSAGRHCRLATRAAKLVRARVDSPPESRLRLCLVLAGLPEPWCNVTIGVGDLPVGKPDLGYFQFKLALEYEGDHHRTERGQWNTDIARYEDFAVLGWHVIRVTAARLRRPRQLVSQVHDVLRARGYDGPAPAFSSEWFRLFER